jgi:hypothetical protein
MEEPTSPEEVASIVEPDDGTVEVNRIGASRIEFTFDSHVHAHRVPDKYQIVGFGSGWFAIK